MRLPVLSVQEDEHRQIRRPGHAGRPVRPDAPVPAEPLGGDLVHRHAAPAGIRPRQPVQGARGRREFGVGDRVATPAAGQRKVVQRIGTAPGAQQAPVVGGLRSGAVALVHVEVVRAPPVVPQSQRPVPHVGAGGVLHQVALGIPRVAELVGQHLDGSGARSSAPQERHGHMVVATERVRSDERRAGAGHPGPELLGAVRVRERADGFREAGQRIRPCRPGRSLGGVQGRDGRDHGSGSEGRGDQLRVTLPFGWRGSRRGRTRSRPLSIAFSFS